ncbi:MAG TPA: peptidoglycan-binding protein [Chthoniobacterales bacterium]|nr:peptidoglycan-binding protein [Chthoniobacterales bacterium]
MRIFIVSLCSLALVGIAYGAQKQEKKSTPKKQAHTAQHAAQPAHAAGAGASGKKASTAAHQAESNRGSGRSAAAAATNAQRNKKNQSAAAVNQRQTGRPAHNSNAANQSQKSKKNQNQAERQKAKAANQSRTANAANAGSVSGTGKPNQAKRTAAAANNQSAAKGKFAKNKPVKPQHFNLSKQPNTAKAPPVKFQQGRQIQGSQNWQGQKYAVFRNYKAQWHDQNWWHNHYHNNFVFVFGAPYYWNAGYWFPAWGYYPNAYYAWDGPIYGYNRMPPDQVIANVQSVLQEQGYYHGEVDGLIGPLTRGAIADYQRDHGLYTTSTIDQPTLQSLGIA